MITFFSWVGSTSGGGLLRDLAVFTLMKYRWVPGFSGHCPPGLIQSPSALEVVKPADCQPELAFASATLQTYAGRLPVSPSTTQAVGTAPMEGHPEGTLALMLDTPAPAGGLVMNGSNQRRQTTSNIGISISQPSAEFELLD